MQPFKESFRLRISVSERSAQQLENNDSRSKVVGAVVPAVENPVAVLVFKVLVFRPEGADEKVEVPEECTRDLTLPATGRITLA